MRRYEITTGPSSLSHEVEWASQHKNWKGLITVYKLALAAAFYTMFAIQRERNSRIFQNIKKDVDYVIRMVESDPRP